MNFSHLKKGSILLFFIFLILFSLGIAIKFIRDSNHMKTIGNNLSNLIQTTKAKIIRDVFPPLAVGFIYFKGVGVEQNFEKAKKYFEEAAEQGDEDAMILLGGMYLRGDGIEKNEQKAVEWLQKAAKRKNLDAQLVLDIIFNKKSNDTVIQNHREYLIQEANQGNADAAFLLGMLYAKGEYSPQDFREAFKWLSQAADQGDSEALLLVSILYAEGRGVEKNLCKALDLVQKALAKNDLSEKLKSIAENLLKDLRRCTSTTAPTN